MVQEAAQKFVFMLLKGEDYAKPLFTLGHEAFSPIFDCVKSLYRARSEKRK